MPRPRPQGEPIKAPHEYPYLCHIVPPILQRRGPMTCLPRALHPLTLVAPQYGQMTHK